MANFHRGFFTLRGSDTRYGFHHRQQRYYHDSRRQVRAGFKVTVVEERTTEQVRYDIYSPFFPIRELFYSLVEQMGGKLRLEQLEFYYHGKMIPFDATPNSLGMKLGVENIITVNAVNTTSYPHEIRQEMLTRMNRMGKVNVSSGQHQGIFGSDILPHILDFCDLGTLVHVTQVCRNWFHVTQRFTVLLQLQDGDTATWDKNQRYPMLLHDGCRHSFNLALCDNNSTSNKMKTPSGAVVAEKERGPRAYAFTKAAGCVMVKTVTMESISRDLDTKWRALDDAKAEFMFHMRNMSGGGNDMTSCATHEGHDPKPMQKLKQQFPPNDEVLADGFITEAVDVRYKNCAIELYRRYFSPDMHYIFPLIVQKSMGVGLDFRSTRTDLIFGSREDGRASYFLDRTFREDGIPTPIGSISWRIHDSIQVAAKATRMATTGTTTAAAKTSHIIVEEPLHGWKPRLVMEVLFIAVWQMDRGSKYGSRLVAKLEEDLVDYAKRHGYLSALLYVEIGYEQPKAKQFWGNHGFQPLLPKTKVILPQEEAMITDPMTTATTTGTLSSSPSLQGMFPKHVDDKLLGFIERRCLRFKDTEQYGKLVIV